MKPETYNQKPEAKKKRSLFHASCFTFHERGFTLLESIIAIGIFTVGISVCINLISSSLANAGTRTRDKVIAGYLAQEGIEAVRSIRDNNWIGGTDWLAGITLKTAVGDKQTGGCVTWSSTSIDFTPACSPYLAFDSALGVPAYAAPPGQARFSRAIDVEIMAVDPATAKPVQIRVTSTVTCGGACSVSLSEYLYNWK